MRALAVLAAAALALFHIGQVRAVVQNRLPLAQERRRQQGQRAVFRSLNRELPAQLRGAVNDDHREHLSKMGYAIL